MAARYPSFSRLLYHPYNICIRIDLGSSDLICVIFKVYGTEKKGTVAGEYCKCMLASLRQPESRSNWRCTSFFILLTQAEQSISASHSTPLCLCFLLYFCTPWGSSFHQPLCQPVQCLSSAGICDTVWWGLLPIVYLLANKLNVQFLYGLRSRNGSCCQG